jgi:hypothetical protein
VPPFASSSPPATQDDILTVDVTTGSLTPNHIPFPGPGYLNTGVATTDGANVFLLFGQDPTQVDVLCLHNTKPLIFLHPPQVDVPSWFIAVIDVARATVVQGLPHPPSKYYCFKPPPSFPLLQPQIVTSCGCRFPIAMHWNPSANGTMILNAMMWSPEGVAGVQVGTLNPYATAHFLLCIFVTCIIF